MTYYVTRFRVRPITAIALSLCLLYVWAVSCIAMLDIFDHPKEASERGTTYRGEVQMNLLDYPNDCFLKGDYKGALNGCRNLLKNNPDGDLRLRILSLMALSYVKLGRYPEARTYFNDICLARSVSEELKINAYLGIGDSYLTEGNFQKAFDAYNQALEKCASLRRGTNNMSGVYYRFYETLSKMDRNEEAGAYLAKLQKEYPLSFEARMAAKEKDNSLGANVCGIPSKDSKYSVQVGCFNDKKNADEIHANLTKKGFDAYIYQSDRADEPKYRVRVGRLSSSDEAQELEAKLKMAGFSTKICP